MTTVAEILGFLAGGCILAIAVIGLSAYGFEKLEKWLNRQRDT